jgi:hypothetical protein
MSQSIQHEIFEPYVDEFDSFMMPFAKAVAKAGGMGDRVAMAYLNQTAAGILLHGMELLEITERATGSA